MSDPRLEARVDPPVCSVAEPGVQATVLLRFQLPAGLETASSFESAAVVVGPSARASRVAAATGLQRVTPVGVRPAGDDDLPGFETLGAVARNPEDLSERPGSPGKVPRRGNYEIQGIPGNQNS